jgi:hypothetical protein
MVEFTPKKIERENCEQQVTVWTAESVDLSTNTKCVKVTYLFSTVVFSHFLIPKWNVNGIALFKISFHAYLLILLLAVMLYFVYKNDNMLRSKRPSSDHRYKNSKIMFNAVKFKVVIWDTILRIFLMMSWWWFLRLKHIVIFLNKI